MATAPAHTGGLPPPLPPAPPMRPLRHRSRRAGRRPCPRRARRAPRAVARGACRRLVAGGERAVLARITLARGCQAARRRAEALRRVARGARGARRLGRTPDVQAEVAFGEAART